MANNNKTLSKYLSLVLCFVMIVATIVTFIPGEKVQAAGKVSASINWVSGDQGGINVVVSGYSDGYNVTATLDVNKSEVWASFDGNAIKILSDGSDKIKIQIKGWNGDSGSPNGNYYIAVHGTNLDGLKVSVDSYSSTNTAPTTKATTKATTAAPTTKATTQATTRATTVATTRATTQATTRATTAATTRATTQATTRATTRATTQATTKATTAATQASTAAPTTQATTRATTRATTAAPTTHATTRATTRATTQATTNNNPAPTIAPQTEASQVVETSIEETEETTAAVVAGVAGTTTTTDGGTGTSTVPVAGYVHKNPGTVNQETAKKSMWWLWILLVAAAAASYFRYKKLKNDGMDGKAIAVNFIPGVPSLIYNVKGMIPSGKSSAPAEAYPQTASTTNGYNTASAMKELRAMEKAEAAKTSTATKPASAPIKRPSQYSSNPNAAKNAAAAGAVVGSVAAKETPKAAPVTSTTPTGVKAPIKRPARYSSNPNAVKTNTATTGTVSSASVAKTMPVKTEPAIRREMPKIDESRPYEKKSIKDEFISKFSSFGKKVAEPAPAPEAYPKTASTSGTTNYAAAMRDMARAQRAERDAAVATTATTAAAVAGTAAGQKAPIKRPAKYSSNPVVAQQAAEKEKVQKMQEEQPKRPASSTSPFVPNMQQSQSAPKATGRATKGSTMNRPDSDSLNINATPSVASEFFKRNATNASVTPAIATMPTPPVREKYVEPETTSPFKPLANGESRSAAPVMPSSPSVRHSTYFTESAKQKAPTSAFSGIVRPTGSAEPVAEKSAAPSPATSSSTPSAPVRSQSPFADKKKSPFKPLDGNN